MDVILYRDKAGKNCSYGPADPQQKTLILMIGVASLRSVKKTIKRNGFTIVKTVFR